MKADTSEVCGLDTQAGAAAAILRPNSFHRKPQVAALKDVT